MYSAKLALLLAPLPYAIPSTFFLLLPILRVNLFNDRSKLSKSQGVFYFIAIGLVSFAARTSTPQRVLSLFLQKEPSESLIYGTFPSCSLLVEFSSSVD